jgi:microcystin-dependent protein
VAGLELVTLIGTLIPSLNLSVGASSASTTKYPAYSFPAYTPDTSSFGSTADLTMNAAMVSGGGGNQPHDNMQPYLVLNWCIALEGIFPSRD